MPPAPPPPDRRLATGVGLAGIYTGLSVWAYFAWYYKAPELEGFLFGGDGYFGENTYAGGADKLGHAWATYALARSTSRLMRWGGMRPVTAAALTSGLSLAFFTFVEVKDGYYYQFSPGDQLANTLGAGLSALLELSPTVDRLLDFRVQYYPSDEYLDLVGGGDVDVAEDYSGQRYLLAVHTGDAIDLARGRSAEWTRWLRLVDVAVGFETRKYKPDPIDPDAVRRQHLFLGLSFNAQGALDLALGHRGGGVRQFGRKFGHGLFEAMNLPFTSVAVGGVSRSPDD
ncbi:MAG: DUF2279 domain-containing protein [Kofleriaceae bacterium]|nr:DUF2279 domain-containing protein [Kofleriaceae bacterium]